MTEGNSPSAEIAKVVCYHRVTMCGSAGLPTLPNKIIIDLILFILHKLSQKPVENSCNMQSYTARQFHKNLI